MHPKISVIIPCYNLGQFLDKAVESVLAQTFKDFEIIIVNDGSTDEYTNSLLSEYSKPKCTIYTTHNQGLPAARNFGIERSHGIYISCLDPDDKYHPDFLEKCVNVLDADNNIELGFITTWVTVFGDEEFIWETADYNLYQLVIENQIHVASLFRKSVWEEVNGYSTNLSGYHDWDFWLKIVACGYKWDVIKTPLFYYRKRPNSMIKQSERNKPNLRKTILSNNLGFVHKHAAEIIIEYDKYFQKSLMRNEEQQKVVNATLASLKELEYVHSSLCYRISSSLRHYLNKVSNLFGKQST